MGSNSLADVVARSIAALGVDAVYIYPGGTIAPLVNGFVAAGVKVEVFKHEQGAVYAALAKARLTGKLQVAMVTSGPGVTNAITPLADAFYDSTPLLLITGQVGTGDLLSGRKVRQRGFQEVPTVSMVSAITKAAVCPTTVDEALSVLPGLIASALTGRPGPVVLDFPMDVQRALAPTNSDTLDLRVNPPPKKGIDQGGVAEVAMALTRAKRPVVMLGHGALTAGAFDLYKTFAKKVQAMVVTSLPGLGVFDGKSNQFLGYVGHTGHEVANTAVHESDFLLVLGARLDVRQTGTMVNQFVPNGQVAWVNDDATELSAPRVGVRWPVLADVADFLEALNEHLDTHDPELDTEWQQKLRNMRLACGEDSFEITHSADLFPKEVLQQLNKCMDGERGVVVTGVGSHQQWAARHLTYAPKGWRFLTSAGHGAMGYDIPSAVGAAMTYPGEKVLCVVGDGSFLMNVQELAAMAERKLNVKVLLLNNQRLGIVSQFQRITWGDDHGSGEFLTPDFVAIAKGFGIPAERLLKREQLGSMIQKFWDTEGPVLLEVQIDHDADVVPMLLGGQTMGEMWQGNH